MGSFIVACVLLWFGLARFYNKPAHTERDDVAAKATQSDRAKHAVESEMNPDSKGLSSNPAAPNAARKDSQSIATSQKNSGAGSAAFPVSQPVDATDLSTYKEYKYPTGTPKYEGENVTAFVHVKSSEQAVKFQPNQMGEYPRVWMQQEEVANIQLAFPETKPGTPVAISAQDGGSLDGVKIATSRQVDENGRIAFDFKTSPNPGIHRVSVMTASGEVKILDFWAGDPPVLQKASAQR